MTYRRWLNLTDNQCTTVQLINTKNSNRILIDKSKTMEKVIKIFKTFHEFIKPAFETFIFNNLRIDVLRK